MGKAKNEIFLDGTTLDIETIYRVATAEEGVQSISIKEEAYAKMKLSREFILQIVQKGQPVYGINTGFGALSNKFIESKDLGKLQLNLIRSHCAGVGRPFSKVMTRAIMLLRANCLVTGHSGINPSIVQLLIDLLNFHITPVVPEKGSVGASGDLAPLAHIALSLIGEGQVEYKGKIVDSKEALLACQLSAITLGPKDGLALINGTAVMTALGCMALYEAKKLAKLADISAALTLEGVRGSKIAFMKEISDLKPHPGQIITAQNITRLLEGSEVIQSHLNCSKVQDAYSLRCVPQVHGACRQTLEHAWLVLSIEINSVTDNPLIFVDTQEVVSGGNFHGEALAFCMDYLTIGLAEFCNILERRVEKMMNPTFSELPPFLTKDSGLNSGLMIAHVTAAALVSENKYLSHPASVDSVPTSTDKEDHVSMGVTAGLKLQQVLQNFKYCLAIELLCNTQALEFLAPLKTSPPLQAAYDLIRKFVPPIEEDRVFANDINKILELIEDGSLLAKVESTIGELK